MKCRYLENIQVERLIMEGLDMSKPKIQIGDNFKDNKRDLTVIDIKNTD